MKVSIITATYNSAGTLRDTMESLLGQDYPDIEYIIVDGGSKDSTLDIVREYEGRFKGRLTFRSEPDKGIYDAMNKGIGRATGDIVGILNSDDFYIDSRVISGIVECFEKEGVDCVYGNIYMVDENNTDKIIRNWISKPFVKGSFKRGWHPPHPATFFRRRVYENYGVFDLDFPVCADFELMLRMMEKHGVSTCFVDKHLVKMRMGGASTGSLISVIKTNINVMDAFKKNGIRINRLFFPIKKMFPKFIQYFKRPRG